MMKKWKQPGAVIVGLSMILSAGTPVFAQGKQEQSSPISYFKPGDWNYPGSSSPVIHKGTPRSAGLYPDALNSIDTTMNKAMETKMFPGGVVLIARKGSIAKWDAYGYASRYTDDQYTELEHPVPMRKDTIFDLASISKIFTTTAAMKLYEQGKFQLDDPVYKYIPEFKENGKEKVTIRQLLTHTSGFEPFIPVYKMGTNREDRLHIILTYPLKNSPGTTYTYSDLNMITLGVLVERLSGKRLDEYVKEVITGPLKMRDTMYNPPAYLKPRIAATEYEPYINRGMVWGEVHDENAWSLDGVAGHAGVFSSAHDLAVFAHMFLQNGKYGHTRILKPSTVKLLEENQLPQFPSDSHGLGWELDQGWYMDALSDATTLGHTGFTGTTMVISPKNQTVVLTLTNRVHPTRTMPSINPVRRDVARAAADAIPVSLANHEKAWFAGYGDKVSRPLVYELNKPASTVSFETWFEIEKGSDNGTVEVSADGVNWQKTASSFTGKSNGWKKQTTALPAGTKFIRFLYTTDASVNGRGWYVKDVKAKDASGKEIAKKVTDSQWTKRNH
ncbi:CubicO group peptidase, beta-lactamase class C family [Fictibacillus enclensis]|uniref:Serine hydrolase n=1 Tax=Fictibacillus enclensis TaxID=1017270 RepID=A0A0V8J922_9BACL|nr:serine hydrolase [Fictibacillus enclensis]SCC15943.1 CubicO group peptidase, beta-lactamase class C family [Fictibacillus enclensis]